ncbi:TDT family transporter [Streptomyces sp. BBFR102]|uniref:TDT family transporter n=1 Tax=Streptomyces sp. BBFR102 TaxID=3448171 RepID=UPI003F530114
MVSLTTRPAAPPASSPVGAPPRRLPALRHLGPNWYASVMGTAIVATAGAGLPWQPPGLRTVLAVVWALSALLLVVLLAARTLHWVHHRDQARAHLLDASMAPFYGCLAMALLAVGGATLVVGSDWIGVRAAVAVDVVLFTAGTVTGVLAAVTVPYLMVTRQRPPLTAASPVWLLPVVAPMVSAALGPLLVPHLASGQLRLTLLYCCYGLFGLSLLGALLMLPLVLGRLLTGGPPALALTPTLFLALGPLGQSTTAVHQLAEVARDVVPGPYAEGFAALAVLYGVPVMGFAALWLGLAGALAVRALRRGMGFSLTWWGFTFPVGTCVTGLAGLGRQTGLPLFELASTGLYVLLVAAWLVACAGTVRRLVTGRLPAPPA